MLSMVLLLALLPGCFSSHQRGDSNVTSLGVDVLTHSLRYLRLSDQRSAQASCRGLRNAFIHIPMHQQIQQLFARFDDIMDDTAEVDYRCLSELRALYDKVKLSELFRLQSPKIASF